MERIRTYVTTLVNRSSNSCRTLIDLQIYQSAVKMIKVVQCPNSNPLILETPQVPMVLLPTTMAKTMRIQIPTNFKAKTSPYLSKKSQGSIKVRAG